MMQVPSQNSCGKAVFRGRVSQLAPVVLLRGCVKLLELVFLNNCYSLMVITITSSTKLLPIINQIQKPKKVKVDRQDIDDC